jgi:hypothetical protein
MKEGKRNPVTLSLDEAKQMYQIENLKDLALSAFTKEELEGIKPPEFDEEFYLEGGGWFIDDLSDIDSVDEGLCTERSNYNVFPERGQAEACRALSRLCQLRAHPFWADECNIDNSNKEWKHVIISKNKVLDIGESLTWDRFLSFKTNSGARKFLNMYRELIQKATPFI